MELNIAGIVDDSIVDGDGCRLTVFVQGCQIDLQQAFRAH